jgi:hypothetical protein
MVLMGRKYFVLAGVLITPSLSMSGLENTIPELFYPIRIDVGEQNAKNKIESEGWDIVLALAIHSSYIIDNQYWEFSGSKSSVKICEEKSAVYKTRVIHKSIIIDSANSIIDLNEDPHLMLKSKIEFKIKKDTSYQYDSISIDVEARNTQIQRYVTELKGLMRKSPPLDADFYKLSMARQIGGGKLDTLLFVDFSPGKYDALSMIEKIINKVYRSTNKCKH